jgi:hypothetical protein
MAELASQPTSIQSLYGWFRRDILYVNRRYQRKLVWTLEEKQKLIDSILHKYPIPAILVAEREDSPGTYEIIDGLQRLHAIVSFIETAFPTSNGTYFNLDFFPTAKSSADEGLFTPSESDAKLLQREVTTILDYTLALSVMRNATEIEINDVFDRINTYGHRLSDQERRQAGVQNEFSDMVREIACEVRGDVSDNLLLLKSMPSISIDLPMSRHGYAVQADEVFWVAQGVLRATDLRDSMDEQCIADISACLIGGQIIERSKEALDQIYLMGSDEASRIQNAIEVYGSQKFSEEFKFCIDEILKVCAAKKVEKLRDIIYSRRTTNAFPSLFALLAIAFHELILGENKSISDYAGVRDGITGISDRLDTSRRATSPEERRKNINTIKGLIRGYFIEEDIKSKIYGNHTTTDIESNIRRSEIELSDYELKQGLLSLSDDRKIDDHLIEKVVKTACAIANNGPNRIGKILIGVSDKEADAQRIKSLDGIEPKKVGRRFVVGVIREAIKLGISLEDYYAKWKLGFRNSNLSQPLLDSVLSSIDYNEFYGLGVIVITIHPQKELSYFGEEVCWRDGDETKIATSAKQIASLAQRF